MRLTVEDALARGVAALNAGHAQQAVGELRAALAENPRAAEVHYNLGVALQQTGDRAAALDAYRAAIALKPDFAQAHINLGNAQLAVGDVAAARTHAAAATHYAPGLALAWNLLGLVLQRERRLEEAQRAFMNAVNCDARCEPALDNVAEVAFARGDTAVARIALSQLAVLRPDDDGVRFRLDALDGKARSAAPPTFVAQLFDHMAEEFDTHLVERLGYRIPVLLRERLEALGTLTQPLDVLDLGCGTGLFGVAIKPFARALAGCDLSARMIEAASQRGIYDSLAVADIDTFLTAQRTATADLMVATDVFVYVGALDTVFAHARDVLRDGGSFAFSLETCDGDGFVLQPSSRFAHSDAYVRRLAEQHDFHIVDRVATPIRAERNVPIPGAVFVLRKGA